MSVDEENDRGRRVATELIENRRIFSALSRSAKELVGILGWRIAAANGISGDLIENLRIYSGSSGALPNGTLPPSVHNGRSSSVAVPLPVTVMPRTDRIFFSIVQQQMLSMKFLQLFVQQQNFQQSGEEFAEIFVKDEFYESFEAPKFHDFTAPEEEAGDPDAWFSETSDPRAGGMTTKETAGAQENSSLLQIPPKTQQILVLEQKKAVITDAHKSAPVSSSLLLSQTSGNFSAAKKMDVSSSSSSSSPWCLLAFINSSLKILQTAHPFTSCWTTTSLGSKF